MNKDVIILRETVKKLIPMLAERDIRVTQSGVDAYVKWHPKTLEPQVVNIPHLPDNASEALIVAIQGFLDHEVAHLLFTDSKVVGRAFKEGKRVASMHNIIEDTYIERMMQKRFKGSSHNLEKVGEFFLEEFTKPKLAEVVATGDVHQIASVLMVPMMRAWSGQKVFQDFMDDGDKWKLIEPYVKALEPIKDEVPKVRSSEQALNVTRKAIKGMDKLRPAKPESEEGSKGESSAPSGGGEPEREEGEGAGGSDEDKTPSKVKVKTEKPKKDEGDDEAPAPEKSEDEGGSTKRPDEVEFEAADEDDESDDPAPADESKDDDADAASEGDEDDAGGAGDEDAEEDDLHESDGLSEDADDADDDSDREEEAGGADEGDEGDEGDDADGVDPDDSDDKTKVGGEAWFDEEAENSFFDGLEENSDFDGVVAAKISDEAVDATKAADYRVFTKDYDKVEPWEVGRRFSESDVQDLEDRVRHMTGLMQKSLERMMAAKSRVAWQAGRRSGRLHAAGLHRLAAGDPRVFRKKETHRSKEVAVSLVVDCSGSMSGGPIKAAMISAYALSNVLERIGVSHEVIGFTTRASIAGLHDREVIRAAERRLWRPYSRYEALQMPIFKDWNERLTTDTKKRFADCAYNAGFGQLLNNVDGECVEIAGLRLAQRREQRKVMIVLSDGMPAAVGNAKEQYAHLKQTVESFARSGMECIGIGIFSEAVKRFYPKHIVLEELDDLPGQVMKELTDILA
jgi:cobalamin biosynthesis protein CobT